MKRFHYVQNPEQLHILLAPPRLRIVEILQGVQALTIPEIAVIIGSTTPRLTYHFHALEEAGFIKKLGQKKTKGRPVALYQAVAKDLVLDRKRLSEDLIRLATKELLSQAAKDALSGSPEAKVARVSARLSKPELEAVIEHLDQIESIFQANTLRSEGDEFCFTFSLKGRLDSEIRES